ncbi:MAG TPA: AtpZ/AtpI family protein [Polyangiaceae bacterium]|jgi:ATP synthase protein I
MAATGPKRAPPPAEERMRQSVARFEQRRRRWRAERGRTLVVAAAVAGIGWVIVMPALAGFALGHWLDARYRAGVVFSAGLGMLGLAFGCWAAWRHIARQREDRREGGA